MKNKNSFIKLIAIISALTLAGCGEGTPSLSNLSSLINPDTSSAATGSSTDSTAPDTSSSSSVEEEMKGTGTKTDPFLPTSYAQLASLSTKLTEDNTYVSLTTDIDLGDQEWTPIGNTFETLKIVHFEGNCHTIKGLKISKTASPSASGYVPYGLFGFATGWVRDVNIEGSIKVTASGKLVAAGLVAGIGENLSIIDCHVKGDVIVDDDSAVEGDVSYAGGVIGYCFAMANKYITITGSSAISNVSSLADFGAAGGVVGSLASSFSSIGANAVSSCVSEADLIKGTVEAGGIAAETYYYSSITNCVSKIDAIETTGAFNGDSYAGGIVGSTYLETAFLFNVANVTTVKAASDVKNSFVGDISGDVTDDEYANGYDQLGSALFGNLASGATLSGATGNPIVTSTPVTSLTAAQLKAIGFDEAWDVADGKLPSLKDDASTLIPEKGKATLHANDGGNDSKQFDIALNSVNSSTTIVNSFTYENHTLINMSYDKDANVAYRWYAPVNCNIDLYDQWFDATKIAGFHLGADSFNMVIKFDVDGSMTMLDTDYCSSVGTWWSDGEYIVLHCGDYDDVVATIAKDGTFSFADLNAGEYTYTYRTAGLDFGYWHDSQDHSLYLAGDGTGIYSDGESAIACTYTKDADNQITLTVGVYYDPAIIKMDGDKIIFTLDDGDNNFTLTLSAYNGVEDYSKKAFVGTYKGSTYDLDVKGDGNITIHKSGSTSDYAYAGYKAYGSTLNIKCVSTSSVVGTYVFDKNQQVIASNDGKNLYAMNGTYKATYATSDYSLSIFVYSDKTYIVKNGKLSNSASVEGTLADGETIVVDGSQYKVSGTTLTYVDPLPDVSPLVNTYTATVGTTTHTLVLAADRTGTYDGKDITFTFDGNSVLFTASGVDFTLAWNATNKTLIGKDGDGNSYSFSVYVAPSEVKTLVGSWTGKVLGNTWTINIKADGTLELILPAATFAGKWTGDIQSEITITADFSGLTGTFKILDSGDKARLDASDDDYNDYAGDFARA
jgi:hypothetical protein